MNSLHSKLNQTKCTLIPMLDTKLLLIALMMISISAVYSQTASSILPDIVNFKLEFPLDPNGNDYEGVSYNDRDDPHIKNDIETSLGGYTAPSPFNQYFYVSNNEVVFKAHCAGALTSVNAYPRCELRQRINGQDTFWEFSDEHELNATFRVTNLPNVKKEVCMLQIKGNTSTSTSGTKEVFRLEYREGSQGLHMVENENNTYNNIMPYSKNQTLKARLYINNNRVYIELTNQSTGDTFNYDYNSAYQYGYFKAGAYTQSSIWEEKNGVGDEQPNAYGEVRFSELTLGESTNSGCTATVPGNRVASNVGSTTATLNWNFDPNIDHYNVRYRKTGTSSWSYVYSINSGSVNISGLTSNTTYQWQVRAKCGNGGPTTSYSSGAGANFTTSGTSSGCTATVPGNRVATNVGTTTATLNWNFDPNIDHYNVRYRKTGTSSWSYVYSINSGSVNITGLNNNTTYQWQVRAKCGNGGPTTSYSSGAGANFTTGGSSSSNDIVMMRKRNAMSYALDGGNGGGNDQNVYIWSYSSNNNNQKWIEIDRGNNHYSYQKLNTNYCIDGGNGGAETQNVKLWSCDSNNENQQWKKISMGSGAYRLEKRNSESYSIDGKGGGEDGQNVHLWTNNNNNQNQHWVFEVVGTSSIVGPEEPIYVNGMGAVLSDDDDQISVYPNPFDREITVELPNRIEDSKTSIRLVDGLGRTVFSSNQLASNEQLVITQNLQPGMYILQWLDENGKLLQLKKLMRK